MQSLNMMKIKSVDSLVSLSIDYIIGNLCNLPRDDIKLLSLLPEHIKNRMLHKFTTTSFFWRNIDFHEMLIALTHKNTPHLDLTLACVSDETLKIIEPCVNLRELYLTRVGETLISTQGLLNLIPRLKRIYLLRISCCDAVTDEVMRCIAENCPDLSGLDVGRCKNVTDKALTYIAGMRNLIWLTFSSTQVSDIGINILLRGASGTNLKELRLANCPNITERILQYAALHCPHMEVLVFHNCRPVQDHTCFTLQEGSLQKLKQINWTIEW